jgi:hypothetical protein
MKRPVFPTNSQSNITVVRGKVRSITGHEGPDGEYRYSYTLSLTSALDGVGGQSHASAVLPPGKRAVPTEQEAGWDSGPV